MTALILAGRFLEARAKWRSGAAVRALLPLGAKDVTVLHGIGENAIFQLADAPIVVRIGRSADLLSRVEKGLTPARPANFSRDRPS